MSQSLSLPLANGTSKPASEKKKRSKDQETGSNKRRRKDPQPDLNDNLPNENGGHHLPGKSRESSDTLFATEKTADTTKRKRKRTTTDEYVDEPKTVEAKPRNASDMALVTEKVPSAPGESPINTKRKKHRKAPADEEFVADSLGRTEVQPLENGLLSDSAYAGQIFPSEAAEIPAKKRKKKAGHITAEEFEPAAIDLNHAEAQDDDEPTQDNDMLVVEETNMTEQPTVSLPPDLPSPFHSVRLSLYVPLYAVSLTTATNSLLSTHLAPLLLTYFPPAQGVVLSFSDPSISARSPKGPGQTAQPPSISHPITPTNTTAETRTPTPALAGDDQGTSWVWLTTTLLIFRPTRHTEMQGHVNICSEGFIGLVLYNYFQTGIARSRIPKTWRWEAAGWDTSAEGKKSKKGKKTKLNDHADRVKDSQESETPWSSSDGLAIDHAQDFDAEYTDAAPNSDVQTSHFVMPAGEPVLGAQRFRVVDLDVVPVSGGNLRSTRYSLQIQGTLLDEEAEQKVRREEKVAYERLLNRRARRVDVAAAAEDDEMGQGQGQGMETDVTMSGGLGVSGMEED